MLDWSGTLTISFPCQDSRSGC